MELGEPETHKKQNFPLRHIIAKATVDSIEFDHDRYPKPTKVEARLSVLYGKKKGQRIFRPPPELLNIKDKLSPLLTAVKKKIAKKDKSKDLKATAKANNKRQKVSTGLGPMMAIMRLAQMDIDFDLDSSAQLQEWLVNIFIEELKSKGSLDLFSLTDASEGTLSWFNECVQASAIKFNGEFRADGGSLTLHEILMTLTLAGGATGVPPATLDFTTDKKVREIEFGQGSTQYQSDFGYDTNIECILFALKSASSVSFASLLKLLRFETIPWVASLLSLVKLQRRVSTPQRACRSGIWYMPQLYDRTILRLEMQPDPNDPLAGTGALVDFFSHALGPVFISNIIVSGTCTYESSEGKDIRVTSESTLTMEADFKLSGDAKPFLQGSLACKFATNGIELALSLSKDSNVLTNLLEWLNERLLKINSTGMENPSTDQKQGGDTHTAVAKEFKDVIDKVKSKFFFHSVSLQFVGKDKKLSGFRVDLEIPLPYGTGNAEVPVLASFGWANGHFEFLGEIWNEVEPNNISLNLNPYHEAFSAAKIFTPNPAGEISIPKLIGKDIFFPDGIPSVIDMAQVRFSYGPGAKSISIEGSVECDPQSMTGDVPTIWFDTLYLGLTFDFGTSDFSLDFRGIVEIEASPDVRCKNSLIELDVSVSYARWAKQSSWEVFACVHNVQVANLFSLFATDGSNHTIMDMMSQLQIPYAGIRYNYSKSVPSALEISGIILLGPVELDLIYKHDSKGWSFSANMGAAPTEKKEPIALGQLIKNLVDDLESIPEFITSLSIPREKLKISLKCFSTSEKGSGNNASGSNKPVSKQTVFCLDVEVGDFSFAFAQIQRYVGQEVHKPIRILRFAVSGLPEVKQIPILENMKQPFDQIDIAWLSSDVTQHEITSLNDNAFSSHSPLLFKDNVKGSASSNPARAVLTAGCHFQIVAHEQHKPSLILDYMFGTPKKTPPPAGGSKGASGGQEPAPKPVEAGNTDPQTSVVPMVKSFGPLSIRNIGLKMESSNTLVIILDASVRLGPVTFALLGFCVKLNFSKVKSIHDFSKLDPSVDLSGMAVGFDRPPTRLAGMFSKFSTATGHSYMGGIAVSVGVWTAIAAGAYEERADFKSLFVFGMLQGPLLEFGCAEVNGITGGFGYNSHLRMPIDIPEVVEFPFIALNTGRTKPNSDITQQLVELTSGGSKGYISSMKDLLWFAAGKIYIHLYLNGLTILSGLGIKAFQLLDVQAVIALDLSSEPKFGIFAEAMYCSCP
jgi:uncharacterized protein DUF6603